MCCWRSGVLWWKKALIFSTHNFSWFVAFLRVLWVPVRCSSKTFWNVNPDSWKIPEQFILESVHSCADTRMLVRFQLCIESHVWSDPYSCDVFSCFFCVFQNFSGFISRILLDYPRLDLEKAATFLTLFQASSCQSPTDAKNFGTKLAYPCYVLVSTCLSLSHQQSFTHFPSWEGRISLAAILTCFTQPLPNLSWSCACYSWVHGAVGKQSKTRYLEALRHDFQQPIQRTASN